jgi:hypothetical protein
MKTILALFALSTLLCGQALAAADSCVSPTMPPLLPGSLTARAAHTHSAEPVLNAEPPPA